MGNDTQSFQGSAGVRVYIEFDISVGDLDESAIDDLIADWTYEMRSSRRLNLWNINYDK